MIGDKVVIGDGQFYPIHTPLRANEVIKDY